MNLEVSDETLRDGEQQVGVFFTSDEKKELARLFSQVGVKYIHTMPIVCEEEASLTRELVEENLPIQASTMMGERYVNHSLDLGVESITLFTPVSDKLLSIKGKTKESSLAECKRVIEYASFRGLKIDFALEDASRADIGYIAEIAQELGSNLRYLVLCDTVGCLQPNLSRFLIKGIKRSYSGKLGVHYHNDMGLAIENTIQAVLADAELISGTFTGIGERAGNVNLEETLIRLKDEHKIEVTGLDYDRLKEVSEKVREYAGEGPAQPMSRKAFFIEAGIHVHSMLQDPQSYIAFPNKDFEIWFGKHSGASNYHWLFEQRLKEPLDESQYQRMRDTVKHMAIKNKRSYNAQEVEQMYRKGII